MCGLPCSGKSTRAAQLKSDFQRLCPDKEVVVINDEQLDIKPEEYEDKDDEKKLRGKQLSAVRKNLSKNRIVILDALAYIKGFRYQIYCDARNAEVPSCVVYVATKQDECELRNARLGKWPTKLLQELCMRFEEPDGMARWDSPLFVDVLGEKSITAEAMMSELLQAGKPKPNASTFKPKVSSPDYVSTVSQITNDLVKEALQMYQTSAGQTVKLGGVDVTLPLNLTMPQLSRIRRNFQQLASKRIMDVDNIATFFVEFMEQQWNITY